MDRQEFLDGLAAALAGEVSRDTGASNLRYYRDYIAEEVSKGRSEAEVLEELGDPRLIARSIVDAQMASEEQRGYAYADSGEAEYAYREAAARSEFDPYGTEDGLSQTVYQDGAEDMHETIRGKMISFTGLQASLISVAVLLVILFILSFVFKTVLKLLFSPVFWLLVIGYLAYRTFTGKNGRY